jgi:CO/xanthine dehydrogenase FAD-binding subunit
MRPIHVPTTLPELWEILNAEPEPAVYSGGTDLLVKLKSGTTAHAYAPTNSKRTESRLPAITATPSALVCLERIHELKGIRDMGSEVFIGAATTHSRIADNRLIRERFPVLAKASSVIGSPPIRHMGTLGGNIVTASPAADTVPALHVLRAEVELASADALRRVSLSDFITGPGSVALRKGEIVAGVWLPNAPTWSIQHYEKVGRRKAQACAVVSMAAVLQVSDRSRIERVRLAWGSVGPTAVTCVQVEDALKGRRLCESVLREAADEVKNAVSPIDDVRASAEYRRIVAGQLLLRLSTYQDGGSKEG